VILSAACIGLQQKSRYSLSSRQHFLDQDSQLLLAKFNTGVKTANKQTEAEIMNVQLQFRGGFSA
jgi:hypothetical protein